jgi:hypothetical protein
VVIGLSNRQATDTSICGHFEDRSDGTRTRDLRRDRPGMALPVRAGIGGDLRREQRVSHLVLRGLPCVCGHLRGLRAGSARDGDVAHLADGLDCGMPSETVSARCVITRRFPRPPSRCTRDASLHVSDAKRGEVDSLDGLEQLAADAGREEILSDSVGEVDPRHHVSRDHQVELRVGLGAGNAGQA